MTRLLDVPAPDPAEDALARAGLLQQAADAGFARLDELEYDDHHGVAEQVRARVDQRTFAAWEQLATTDGEETPSELYARIRGEMIEAERAKVLLVRSKGKVPSEVVSQVLGMLDIEESMLDAGSAARAGVRSGSLDLRRRPHLRRPRRAPRRRDGRRAGLRHVPGRRHPLGVVAAVPHLRQRGLLRLLRRQARHRPLPRQPAPGGGVRRAGRVVALVLRAQPHRLTRGWW